MNDRLIFVSCGQATDDEIRLGQELKDTIDETPGFSAFFAERESDLEGLSQRIFDALRRCAGIVAILQARGEVHVPDGGVWGIRSSVWVNQEIAIAAFRRWYDARPLPILAFMEPSVKLEGAMTSLIVNPRSLDSSTIVEEVRDWLEGLSGDLSAPDADATFREKWEQLSESTKRILDCLEREGGADVPDDVLWGAMNRYGMGKDDASMRKAKDQFRATGLVRLKKNGASHSMSIQQAWVHHVARALAKWRALQ